MIEERMTMKSETENLLVEEYYDNIARDFDALYMAQDQKTYTNPVSECEDLYIEDLIKSLIGEVGSQQSLRILDLGCGTGYGAEIFSDYIKNSSTGNVTYTGIDISKNMVEEAEKKIGRHPNFQFIQGDMCSLPFIRHHSVDLIISIYGSPGHIASQQALLAECHRCLKPGGILFLMMYSRFSFSNLKKCLSGGTLRFLQRKQSYQIRNADSHFTCDAYFCTSHEICRALEQNEFSLRKIEGMHTLLTFKKFARGLHGRMKNDIIGLERLCGRLFPNMGHYLLVTAVKR